MSEIEKQFMEVFGIESKDKVIQTFNGSDFKVETLKEYPQITDHILLELICLHNIYVWGVHSNTVNELKNILLEKYIEHVNLMADENEKQEYIQQLQALFKEV